MVKPVILLFLIIFYLSACNKITQVDNFIKEEEHTMSEIKMMEEEKELADEQFFESLKHKEISEKDFLLIVKYLIETAKKSDFKDTDPILGKREQMHSKDFKDPYRSYHYVQIPNYPEMEVYLKYRKDNNKLSYFSLKFSGSAGDFYLNTYNLSILDTLNLKVISKELPGDSNQVFKYQLTDGKLRYEVYGKDNIDNEPPKEFYIFRIYLD